MENQGQQKNSDVTNLQIQADQIAETINRNQFNCLMAFKNPPTWWTVPLKIICPLISNKSLKKLKLISSQNKAQPAKIDNNQLFNYFKKITLGQSKKINELLKEISTGAVTNEYIKMRAIIKYNKKQYCRVQKCQSYGNGAKQ